METKAQRLLSAAVKMGRAPNACVVFEADPRGVTAAHNASMKAVALTSLHPAWEFGAADLTVASFSDLSVVNVRRLFALDGLAWMDLAAEKVAPPARGRRGVAAAVADRDRPEAGEEEDDDVE